jgi:hypothetical protein
MRGDTPSARRLLAVAANNDLHISVGPAALELACEKADADIAEEIVRLLKEWATGIERHRTSPEPWDNEQRISSQSIMLYVFATKCPRFLEEAISHPEPLLDLLLMVATGRCCVGDAHTAALNVLTDGKAPLVVRRRYALKIIEASPKSTELWYNLVRLLDNDSVPPLRALVRSSGDPDGFHYAAASALAHLGDLEIKPFLEALMPRFREASVNIGGILEWYIWQIETQHPPERLIQYVSSETNPLLEPRVDWAIQRAVELNLDKDRIRAAILEYAGRIAPNEHGFRMGLSRVKRSGLSLSVLRPDDL